jgi:Flp pilus assembly protein TadD
MKRLAEARTEFSRAHTLAPEDGEALYNLAFTALKLGDHQSARLLLQRLRGINGKLAEELEGELAKTD